jgi:hypothetical protein
LLRKTSAPAAAPRHPRRISGRLLGQPQLTRVSSLDGNNRQAQVIDLRQDAVQSGLIDYLPGQEGLAVFWVMVRLPNQSDQL